LLALPPLKKGATEDLLLLEQLQQEQIPLDPLFQRGKQNRRLRRDDNRNDEPQPSRSGLPERRTLFPRPERAQDARMVPPVRSASWLLLPLLAFAGVQARAQDDVTIYRCTDAQGRLTIGNTPCPQGQQQQTQSMLRPKDAPPSAVVREDDVPVEAPPPVAPRVVAAAAPRPLYECVRPDGSVYESDNGDGDPRWVPLWTLGYPGDAFSRGGMLVQRGGHGGSRSSGPSAPPSGGISASTSAGISAPSPSSISIPPPWERPRPSPPPPRSRPPRPGDGNGYGYGTWVRDECYALPQSEVCERLSDRRDELRRRFFNAQQRERDALRIEERGLNARLANDCGIN
jgi:hypothetical protein